MPSAPFPVRGLRSMGKRRPVPTPEGHQQCHQCLVVQPCENFEPSRDRACGIAARCRPCLAAFRADRAAFRQVIEESAARMIAREGAPQIVPDYEPPKLIPESQRKTDDYFRRIDAQRRRMRLQRRK